MVRLIITVFKNNLWFLWIAGYAQRTLKLVGVCNPDQHVCRLNKLQNEQNRIISPITLWT